MLFDKKEWSDLVMIAEMELVTRMLLCEYCNLFDSKGQAITKPKVLARTVGVTEKDVRKHLTLAKNVGWLETIDIDGHKGYRATVPV